MDPEAMSLFVNKMAQELLSGPNGRVCIHTTECSDHLFKTTTTPPQNREPASILLWEQSLAHTVHQTMPEHGSG